MSKYSKIYFIGIGGIGMSAIARYYKFKGYPVAGYDRTPTDLTHSLEKEGIDVHYNDDPDYIPKDVASTLVIYTPAIPADLKELVYVKEHGYTLVKRSRMLGELAEAVAHRHLLLHFGCAQPVGGLPVRTEPGGFDLRAG